MTVVVSIPALAGVLLAGISFVCTSIAGSDDARISKRSNLLTLGSAALLIAALLLEYHA